MKTQETTKEAAAGLTRAQQLFLCLLTQHNRTGLYLLGKSCDIGMPYKMDELEALEMAGLVSSVQEPDVPQEWISRRMFSITEAGRQAYGLSDIACQLDRKPGSAG